MKYLLVLSFVCICVSGYAHETNEAFFKISEKENTIEVQAEFPWTMRNALMAFNPSLENSTNKKDFENTFIEYIKTNLILKDKNGNLLKYKEYKELETNGHSHQNNYLIIFKGNNLSEITNTVMFNIYGNQVNYNTITVNSIQKIFKTKKGFTHFKLIESKDTKYWYLLFILLLIAYIFYKYVLF